MRFASLAAGAALLCAAFSPVADRSANRSVPATSSFGASGAPQRIVHTRAIGATVDGVLSGIGTRAFGSTLEIPIADRAGVPASAAVVAVNLTVDGPTEQGHLTAFPCGTQRPVAWNLNFRPGDTVAAFALVSVGVGGAICVFNHGVTYVIVDVAGWFPAGDVEMLPAPRRLLDTRVGASTFDGQHQGTGGRPGASTLQLPVGGRAGVPAGASTVVLSVTADDAGAWGHATVHACDEEMPMASNLNYSAGGTVANTVITALDGHGDVCLYTSAAADLIVDVAGWVPLPSTSAAAVDVAAARRVLDTRPGAPAFDGRLSGVGMRPAESTLAVPIAGRAGVPAGTGAVVLNIIADAPRERGWVTLHPEGTERPNASNLNFDQGRTIANLAVDRLRAGGELCAFTSGRAHLVIDVVGWLPGPPPSAGSYENGDRPVLGAFELIATIATSFPGTDGLYRSPSSPEHVQRYLDAARAHGLYLILDIQPGRSDFLAEVRRYEPFLRQPDVGVALDPAWHVGPGQVPGDVVGQVSAAEANAVADYLADIAASEGVGEKLLVVHQFQDRMLTDRALLREPPGIALTIHMDGFGTQQQKLSTYDVVEAVPPFSNGFKLFFDEDIDMFTPAEALRLDPAPDLISYQ